MPNHPDLAARRRRRPRTELVPRIREAARILFARKGYAATTREIAQHAGVSETLLFLYFGDKRALFRDVISSPFSALMAEMRSLPPSTDEQRQHGVDYMTRHVFEMLEGNRDLLRAVMSCLDAVDDNAIQIPALDEFLASATEDVRASYLSAGLDPPTNLDIQVRLSFGTIAASVMLRRWLFPVAPPHEALVATLQQLVNRSIHGGIPSPHERNLG